MQAHDLFRDEQSDFIGWLKLWKAWQHEQERLSSSKLRKWCKEHFLNFMRMREWQDVWRQLAHLERKGDGSNPARAKREPLRAVSEELAKDPPRTSAGRKSGASTGPVACRIACFSTLCN